MTRTNCYWYHEYQDMQATVPTCEYYGEYGHSPCDTECEHFISRKEVSEIVRNLKEDTEYCVSEEVRANEL